MDAKTNNGSFINFVKISRKLQIENVISKVKEVFLGEKSYTRNFKFFKISYYFESTYERQMFSSYKC